MSTSQYKCPKTQPARGEVADVRHDGSGFVHALPALVPELDEGDLAVWFAEMRDNKPSAGKETTLNDRVGCQTHSLRVANGTSQTEQPAAAGLNLIASVVCDPITAGESDRTTV